MERATTTDGGGPAPRPATAGSPGPSVPRWVLPAILLLAVGLRVLAWSFAVQVSNDGVDFLWQAERLLAGDFRAALSHPYHPLTGAAIALVTLLTGELLAAGVIVSIASALVLALAAHAIARRAFPQAPWAAPGAALLASLHWRTLMLTSDVASDGPYLALWLASIAAVLAAVERGGCRRRLLLAGALAGLAYLVRPEGLTAAAAPLIWAAFGARARGTPALAGRIARASVFAAALALVATPYWLVIHEVTGHWALSMKPSMGAAGLGSVAHMSPAGSPLASPIVRGAKPSPERRLDTEAPAPAPTHAATPAQTATSEPEVESSGEAGAASKLGSGAKAGAGAELESDAQPAATLGDWVDSLRRSAEELWTTARLDTWIFVLPGLWLLARRRRGLAGAALLLVAMWLGVGALQLYASGYLSSRHMLAPTLLLVPAGGAGLAWLWRRAARPLPLALLARALVLLALLVQAATGARTRNTSEAPRLEALAFLAARTGPGERLAVHRRKDAWYARRPVLVVEPPIDEPAALAAFGRHGVRWLALDAEDLERDVPHWTGDARFAELARFGAGDDAVVVLRYDG